MPLVLECYAQAGPTRLEAPPSTSRQDQGPVPAAGKHTDTQQNERNAPATQAVLDLPKPQQDQQASGDRTKNDGRERAEAEHKAANDDQLVEFTRWLMIATICLVLATGALWWETRALAKLAGVQAADTKTALSISREVAETAKLSAELSKAALDHSVRASVVESRAYVNVAPIPKQIFVGSMDAEIQIRNIGKTLASKSRSFAKLDLLPPQVPESHFIVPDSNDIPEKIIHPGDSYKVVIKDSVYITEDIYKKLADDTMILFLWGEVRYMDYSGEWRITTFRFQHAATDASQTATWIQSAWGNQAS
jgi:hypothetical protein